MSEARSFQTTEQRSGIWVSGKRVSVRHAICHHCWCPSVPVLGIEARPLLRQKFDEVVRASISGRVHRGFFTVAYMVDVSVQFVRDASSDELFMVIGMGRSRRPDEEDRVQPARGEAQSEPNRSLIDTYRAYASPGTQIDSGTPDPYPGPDPDQPGEERVELR